MNLRRVTTIALATTARLLAQDPTTDEQTRTIRSLRAELNAARAELHALRELADEPDTIVHGAVSLDVTTAYFFRGVVQEKRGVIAEPSVELGWRLWQGTDWLGDVDLTFGTWNSAHSGPTGAGSTRGGWYESDVYATLSAKVLERVAIATSYVAYHSPNGSFATVQEETLSIAFDDAGLLFARGLQPSVTIAFELAGQTDGGDGRGIYAEAGIAPAVDLLAMGDFTTVLSLPVTVGFGVRDYYELPGTTRDDAFGFVDAGLVLTTALAFVPKVAGAWEASLGLHYLALGDTNETRNGGDGDEWIGTFSLRTTF